MEVPLARSRTGALLVLGVLAALRVGSGCGGNASCGGDTLPGGLPRAEERLGALDLQITDSGLAWVGEHAAEILQLFLPDGLTFTMRESRQLGGTFIICPGTTNPFGCPFRVTLAEAKFARTPPDKVTANLRLDIPKQDIPVEAFGSDCTIAVEAMRTPATLDLALGVDPVTRALSVQPTVRPLPGDNLSITGSSVCSAILAGLLTLFRSTLLGVMQAEVQKNLHESLEDQMCTPCASTCPMGTQCGARTLCRHGTGMNARCVAAKQGVSGQIALAPLLGSVATERFAQIRYGVTVGGRTSVDSQSVKVSAIGGAGAEPSTCVPATPERERNEVPAPPLSDRAPDGQPYHAAIAISAAFVEDLFAAVWRSGGLCLRATSRNVTQLTSDAFALVLPSLSKLTDGRSRPVILGVQLEREPRVRIGSGASHVDDRGQRVLDDPLLAVTLPGLVLDLFTIVEERTVRIGRVIQDVTLPLGLDFTPDGRAMTLLVGDASGAVTNARVLDAEILGGTASSLEQAVPALVALALPLALRGLRPIEIPSLSGFGLEPRGVRGEPASAPTHAVIFANLKIVMSMLPGGSLRARTETFVHLDDAAPGHVQLFLGGRGPHAESEHALEWSWRLGGEGPWSLFSPARRLRLDDPRLRLLGEHVLEVRARVAGRPESVDPTPARLVLRIEPPPAASTTGRAVPRGCRIVDAGSSLLWALALIAIAVARARRKS
jgi:hypothetical protein